MSVWIVQTGDYDEEETIAVTSTKEGATRMALDHARANPIPKHGRARRYEMYEWEPDATAWSNWEHVYSRDGEIITETHTRTDVSSIVETLWRYEGAHDKP